MRPGSIIPLASLVIAAAIADCAEPARPPLVLPAAPADKARVVVYCDADPVTDPSWTTVSLDRTPLGGIGPGNVFYRDVAPGTYDIAVRSEQLYPNQVRTLSVGPGTTTFIDVQVVLGWGKSESKPTRPFTLAIVDPATAERAIAPLALSR
jgi:hypothetical protein